MRSQSLSETILRTVPSSCAVCMHADPVLVGEKDFGVSGSDHFEGHRVFDDYRVPIPYYECSHCGFVFTNAFDDWSSGQWREHVYNDQYALADPPFMSERPVRNARMIAALFHRELPEISILDIGGGNGRLSEELRRHGANIQSHGPMFGEPTPLHARGFDLITCFEVIEHVTHDRQREWMRSLADLLRKTPFARILLSTEIICMPFTLGWWYVCPRNGHISIHSEGSLAILAAYVGMEIHSVNPSMHLLSWKR